MKHRWSNGDLVAFAIALACFAFLLYSMTP